MSDAMYWELHSRPHAPEHWWACEHPERPLDGNADCDFFCPGCFAAIEAHAAHHPDAPTVEFSPARPEGVVRLLADVLAEHVSRHGRPSPMNVAVPPPPDVDRSRVQTWPA